MARVPEETIERIRSTADIYDVVAQYVDLKKRGRNFFGLCPFHSEKTPSFSVAPDKQIYHCFGCGAGGNVFSFIVEHQKVSFIEAVQQLGHKYGIQVDYQSGPSNKFFTFLYEVHDIAANLYHNILFSEKGKAALEYLHNRGFNDDTLKKYQIGFAPDSWDTLSNHIKSSSFKDEVYEKTGLPLGVDESLLEYNKNVPPGTSTFIIKPSFHGGISKTLSLFKDAKKRNIKCVVSSTFETSLGLYALALLAKNNSKTPAGINTFNYLEEKNPFYQITQTEEGLSFKDLPQTLKEARMNNLHPF